MYIYICIHMLVEFSETCQKLEISKLSENLINFAMFWVSWFPGAPGSFRELEFPETVNLIKLPT